MTLILIIIPQVNYYALEIIKFAYENNIKHIDYGGNDPYKASWTDKASYNYDFSQLKSLQGRFAYLYKTHMPEFLLPDKAKTQTIQ
ncbi:MAG: hypothetical protein MZV64_26935 [Ignavibacteriales bacterium]|nr:hypothetical protein [Ignavibacteriales bacterium]